MKKPLLLSTLAVASLLFSACSASTSSDVKLSENSGSSNTTDSDTQETTLTNPQEGSMKKLEDFEKISAKTAVISTSKGDITVELYPDKAPVTVASFLELSKKKFYDGIVIHRVEPGFVIQAGDPLTKEKGKEAMWGTGGPGYTIPDEFSKDFSYDKEGVLAMAKTMAPNSGGSQFFITLGPATFLNGQYTMFGMVTKGMDVVKKIEVGDTIKTVTLQ